MAFVGIFLGHLFSHEHWLAAWIEICIKIQHWRKSKRFWVNTLITWQVRTKVANPASSLRYKIEKWLTEVIGHSAPHFAHTADVRWGSLWGECHRHETLPTIHPVLAGSRPAWTQLHKKISTRMCLILTCISSPQLGLGWGALSLLPESPGYNLSISLLYCKSFR